MAKAINDWSASFFFLRMTVASQGGSVRGALFRARKGDHDHTLIGGHHDHKLVGGIQVLAKTRIKNFFIRVFAKTRIKTFFIQVLKNEFSGADLA